MFKFEIKLNNIDIHIYECIKMYTCCYIFKKTFEPDRLKKVWNELPFNKKYQKVKRRISHNIMDIIIMI